MSFRVASRATCCSRHSQNNTHSAVKPDICRFIFCMAPGFPARLPRSSCIIGAVVPPPLTQLHELSPAFKEPSMGGGTQLRNGQVLHASIFGHGLLTERDLVFPASDVMWCLGRMPSMLFPSLNDPESQPVHGRVVIGSFLDYLAVQLCSRDIQLTSMVTTTPFARCRSPWCVGDVRLRTRRPGRLRAVRVVLFTVEALVCVVESP